MIVIRSMCQFVGRETKYEYVSSFLLQSPSLVFGYVIFTLLQIGEQSIVMIVYICVFLSWTR